MVPVGEGSGVTYGDWKADDGGRGLEGRTSPW